MGGSVARDNLIVKVTYQRKIDNNRVASNIALHTWNRRGLVTDRSFPGGAFFTYSTYSSDGDVISNFDGMAREIYEDLNPPNGLWEGTVPLLETTYSGQVVMGCALNLNEHAAAAHGHGGVDPKHQRESTQRGDLLLAGGRAEQDDQRAADRRPVARGAVHIHPGVQFWKPAAGKTTRTFC